MVRTERLPSPYGVRWFTETDTLAMGGRGVEGVAGHPSSPSSLLSTRPAPHVHARHPCVAATPRWRIPGLATAARIPHRRSALVPSVKRRDPPRDECRTLWWSCRGGGVGGFRARWGRGLGAGGYGMKRRMSPGAWGNGGGSAAVPSRLSVIRCAPSQARHPSRTQEGRRGAEGGGWVVTTATATATETGADAGPSLPPTRCHPAARAIKRRVRRNGVSTAARQRCWSLPDPRIAEPPPRQRHRDRRTTPLAPSANVWYTAGIFP